MATAVAATAFFGLPLEYVALAAAGNLLGWYYTAPPLKLSYRRLGELATMAAAGFIMPAAGYAAASGRLDAFFLQSSIPLLLYGLVFILSVEVPDIDEDTAGGKKTWAAALGTERSFMCAAALSAAATVYYMTDPLKAGYGAIIPASLIPVGAGLLAYAKKKKMMATYITASLIVFLASADTILLAAAAGFYPASRI
jgi:1,4-dihydroxy-2-naphthoate octaprenyltransferase